MSNNLEDKLLEIAEIKQEAIDLAQRLEQDFILLIGVTRIEYHSKEDILVIEERTFDRVNLKEELEAAIASTA